MADKKNYYIQLKNATEAQKNQIVRYARMIRIDAVDLDILFKPEDYVNGDMERGHLNQSGWDRLFGKKK